MSESPSPQALWFAVAAGPGAWLVAFMVNLFLMGMGCAPGAVALRWALLLAAGLLALASLAVGWRNWKAVSGRVPAGAGGAPGRDRFAAFSGAALGAVSVALVLATVAAIAFLDPCVRPWGELP